MKQTESPASRSASTQSESENVPRTIKEFLQFTLRQIVVHRKWLLLPLWVLLVVVGLMLVLTYDSHLLPVIYLAF